VGSRTQHDQATRPPQGGTAAGHYSAVVTRPSTVSLSGLFAAQPLAAVLRVLREASRSLTALEVKQALQSGGVAKADADQAWPRLQKRIRSHAQVIVESGHRHGWHRYAFRELSPEKALELLGEGRPEGATRLALAAIVRAALPDRQAELESAARRRQEDIDAVRALAELAIEVEELTANEASAGAMVHRVRARVRRAGLEPIERAGERTVFDRRRHRPIGRPIRDGTPVVVVRPGYVWKAPADDVLISKAIVEE
jgi:hypothetical protein